MKHHLYIDGNYLASSSGETFKSINPANGETIAIVDQASEKDVEKAVLSSEKAFSVWSQMSAFERGRILLKAVSILRERNDELAELEVHHYAIQSHRTPSVRRTSILERFE